MKKLLLLIMTLSIICLAACDFGDTSESSSSDSTESSSISSETNSSDFSENLGDSSSNDLSADSSSIDLSDSTSEDLSSDSSDDSSNSSGNDSTQKQVYTVTFKQEGAEDIVKTVEEGEALTDIPTPNQIVGYNVEWSVTDFSNITENMTVNAVPTAKKYKITYTLGTRENDSMAQLVNKEQQVEYDAAYVLETPTCEGYIFTGWLLENTTTIFEDGVWNIDSDVTLVAQWTVDPSSNRDHTGRY